jgi:hypothetical protein
MDFIIGLAVLGVIGYFAWKNREKIRSFVEKITRRTDDTE